MDEDKVLAAIAALRGEIGDLRSVVMGKLEQVQDQVTAVKADIAVVSFSAMRAVKRTDADREDMRDLSEMVNKMWLSMLRMKTDIDELQKRA